jgi:hypothetical protein
VDLVNDSTSSDRDGSKQPKKIDASRFDGLEFARAAEKAKKHGALCEGIDMRLNRDSHVLDDEKLHNEIFGWDLVIPHVLGKSIHSLYCFWHSASS